MPAMDCKEKIVESTRSLKYICSIESIVQRCGEQVNEIKSDTLMYNLSEFDTI